MPIGLTRFHPNMTTAELTAVLNEMAAQIENLNRVYVIRDATGTNRVLLGQGLNEFNGLKVSKATYDVTNATADQLVFNSDNNVFKIVKTGVVNATKPINEYVWFTDVTHSLGFVPAVLAFIEVNYGFGLSYEPLPNIRIDITDGTIGMLTKAYADATKLRIEIDAPTGKIFYGSAQSFNIRYYLLQETAT